MPSSSLYCGVSPDTLHPIYLSAVVAGTLSTEDWKSSVPPFDFLQYVEKDEEADTATILDFLQQAETDPTTVDTVAFADKRAAVTKGKH